MFGCGLEDIACRVLESADLCTRLINDQCGHPVVICKAGPALVANFELFVGARGLIVAIICFCELSRHVTDCAFVQNKEVFEVGRLTMARNRTVRRKADSICAIV